MLLTSMHTCNGWPAWWIGSPWVPPAPLVQLTCASHLHSSATQQSSHTGHATRYLACNRPCAVQLNSRQKQRTACTHVTHTTCLQFQFRTSNLISLLNRQNLEVWRRVCSSSDSKRQQSQQHEAVPPGTMASLRRPCAGPKPAERPCIAAAMEPHNASPLKAWHSCNVQQTDCLGQIPEHPSRKQQP
jgi:hypothetical protein